MLVIEKLEKDLAEATDILSKITLLMREFRDIRQSVDDKEEELKTKFIGERIYWAELDTRYSEKQKTYVTCDLCEGIAVQKNSRGQEFARCGRCSGSGKVARITGKPEEVYYRIYSRSIDLNDLYIDQEEKLNYSENYDFFRALKTQKVFATEQEAKDYGNKLLAERILE